MKFDLQCSYPRTLTLLSCPDSTCMATAAGSDKSALVGTWRTA